MTNAREEIFSRIRLAHAAAPPPALDYADVSRDYRTSVELDRDQVRELLIDRLVDYKALVRHTTQDAVAATVAAALAERVARTAVVPPGLDPAWLAASDVEVRVDGGPDQPVLSVADLDSVDAVVTGCAVAIAETGTLVLDAAPDQGRRVISLIPDYHLCVVLSENLCADVPQGLARLDGTRPVTMISGPSATSDIELNRVEGVHGPRTLEVVIVVSDPVVEGKG
jgi:L-lactate dehydrogenase complex protein LldG